MSEKHYIVGAGMFGCLYDYGPNFHATLKAAIDDVAFYTDSQKLARKLSKSYRAPGVRIDFDKGNDRAMYGDYIEISEAEGPLPGGRVT